VSYLSEVTLTTFEFCWNI